MIRNWRLPRFTLYAFLLGMILATALLLSGFSGCEQNHPIINEIMASHRIVLQDNEGDYPDWIEILNPTEYAVSLSDYWLSDHPTEEDSWVFPNISSRPGKHLIRYLGM